MARRGKCVDYRTLIEEARGAVPDFNVSTDIIVGFPGETVREWSETLSFVEEIGFGHLHIFPYSPRAGTKAAGLPEKVEVTEKKRRCRELLALGQRLKRRFMENMTGRRFAVLWERLEADSASGSWHYLGYTPNFCRVSVAAMPDMDLGNRIRPAQIARLATGEDLLVAECEGATPSHGTQVGG